MIAATMWKEYREQRAAWAALAALTMAVTLGIPTVFPPEPSQVRMYHELLCAVAVILSWTFGIVCGGMLLAGEREVGTQSFLDALPAARIRLWQAKFLAGLPFVLAHCVIVAGCLIAGQLAEGELLAAWLLAILFTGLLGYGWGLLCSARAVTVLAAIGQAILGQALIFPALVILITPPAMVAWGLVFRDPMPGFGVFILTASAMLLVPWPVSARIYCAPDRDRLLGSTMRTRRKVSAWGEWRSAWWLAWSQSRGFALGMLFFCLFAGLAVAASGLVVWPIVSLMIGVVCGGTVFLDEQSGPYRFLGDQRFPLGRLWFLKAVSRGVIGLFGLGLMLVPPAFVLLVDLGNRPLDQHVDESIFGRLFGSGLVGITIPVTLFLFTPMLYGFTLAHLIGMLFRKALVALVAGFGLGVLLLSLWAPSIVTGGLSVWQVWLVPAVLVVAANLLLRPWAADRLASRDTASVLGTTAVVSAALLVGGVWYRVAEIPDVGDPPGLQEFIASIPSLEENEAGRAIRGAASQWQARRHEWEVKRPNRPLFRKDKQPDDNDQFMFQVSEVIQRGWPPGPVANVQLSHWLDEVFADDLWKQLDGLPAMPLGMFDDPRRLTVGSRIELLHQTGAVNILLAARGLQMQRKGDPAVFVANFDTALAMVRTIQNGGTDMNVITARHLEAEQLTALDRWLGALNGRPDLLRKAGEVLDKHRSWLPTSTHDSELANFLIGLNSLDQPQEWASSFFRHRERPHGLNISESDILANAWRVPWERERQRRMWRAFGTEIRSIQRQFDGTVRVLLPFMLMRVDFLRQGHARRVGRLGAGRLMVALRHYQAEKGKPARTLDELLPGSIAAIPTDPFDGKPFRYRLSQGETIDWPTEQRPGVMGGAAGPGDVPPPHPEEIKKIPPGQGILWIIGEDHQDDGGRRQGLFSDTGSHSQLGEDLIYLVPLPPPA